MAGQNKIVTDQELLIQISKNDQNALRELVNRHSTMVISIAFGFLKNQEDAEDVAQEVFLKIWEKARQFKGESKVLTWIHRITINSSLNELRGRKKHGFLVDLSTIFNLGTSNNPQQDLINKESKNIFHKAVNSLPQNQNIAFTLRHTQDMSYQEIAELMDISLSSVESLLFRARKNLAKILSKSIKTNK